MAAKQGRTSGNKEPKGEWKIEDGVRVFYPAQGGRLVPFNEKTSGNAQGTSTNRRIVTKKLFQTIGQEGEKGNPLAKQVVEFIYDVALGRVDDWNGKKVAIKERLRAAELVVERVCPAPKATFDETSTEGIMAFFQKAGEISAAISRAELDERRVISVDALPPEDAADCNR